MGSPIDERLAKGVMRNFLFRICRMGSYASSGLLALLRFLLDHCLSFFDRGGREAESGEPTPMKLSCAFPDQSPRSLTEAAQCTETVALTMTEVAKLSSDERLQCVKDGSSKEDKNGLIDAKYWPNKQTDRLPDLCSGQPVFLRIRNEGREVTINDFLRMHEEVC